MISRVICFALLAASARAEVSEIRFPIGAGGVGFLPLLVMQKYGLIEQYAQTVASAARLEGATDAYNHIDKVLTEAGR